LLPRYAFLISAFRLAFIFPKLDRHIRPLSTQARYYVRDANGVRLATVYCRDDQNTYSFGEPHLSPDEARRIAVAIARIPEFLKTSPAFQPRRAETRGKYWKASHPYHVVLHDAYLQENYDDIVACCYYNGVPFDPTGEIFERVGRRWRTFQFSRQFDAIRFWDNFDGRWMLGGDFHFPERPKDLPWMQPLPGRCFSKRPPAR
jgi:hypothetical protein